MMLPESPPAGFSSMRNVASALPAEGGGEGFLNVEGMSGYRSKPPGLPRGSGSLKIN